MPKGENKGGRSQPVLERIDYHVKAIRKLIDANPNDFNRALKSRSSPLEAIRYFLDRNTRLKGSFNTLYYEIMNNLSHKNNLEAEYKKTIEQWIKKLAVKFPEDLLLPIKRNRVKALFGGTDYNAIENLAQQSNAAEESNDHGATLFPSIKEQNGHQPAGAPVLPGSSLAVEDALKFENLLTGVSQLIDDPSSGLDATSPTTVDVPYSAEDDFEHIEAAIRQITESSDDEGTKASPPPVESKDEESDDSKEEIFRMDFSDASSSEEDAPLIPNTASESEHEESENSEDYPITQISLAELGKIPESAKIPQTLGQKQEPSNNLSEAKNIRFFTLLIRSLKQKYPVVYNLALAVNNTPIHSMALLLRKTGRNPAAVDELVNNFRLFVQKYKESKSDTSSSEVIKAWENIIYEEETESREELINKLIEAVVKEEKKRDIEFTDSYIPKVVSTPTDNGLNEIQPSATDTTEDIDWSEIDAKLHALKGETKQTAAVAVSPSTPEEIIAQVKEPIASEVSGENSDSQLEENTDVFWADITVKLDTMTASLTERALQAENTLEKIVVPANEAIAESKIPDASLNNMISAEKPEPDLVKFSAKVKTREEKIAVGINLLTALQHHIYRLINRDYFHDNMGGNTIANIPTGGGQLTSVSVPTGVERQLKAINTFFEDDQPDYSTMLKTVANVCISIPKEESSIYSTFPTSCSAEAYFKSFTTTEEDFIYSQITGLYLGSGEDLLRGQEGIAEALALVEYMVLVEEAKSTYCKNIFITSLSLDNTEPLPEIIGLNLLGALQRYIISQANKLIVQSDTAVSEPFVFFRSSPSRNVKVPEEIEVMAIHLLPRNGWPKKRTINVPRCVEKQFQAIQELADLRENKNLSDILATIYKVFIAIPEATLKSESFSQEGSLLSAGATDVNQTKSYFGLFYDSRQREDLCKTLLKFTGALRGSMNESAKKELENAYLTYYFQLISAADFFQLHPEDAVAFIEKSLTKTVIPRMTA